MEKQQVFYIHGGSAFTSYDAFLHELRTREIRSLPSKEQKELWPKGLVGELGEAYEVFTPQMPNAMNAKYDEWKIWFERHFEHLRDDIVLVGWSLGAMSFARYLAENEAPVTIKHLFLLAGAYENLDAGKLEEDGGDFFAKPEELSKLQAQVGGITILHSKDDFVVPYEHALKYKEALPEAELVTFEDKNHFLVEELPELVEMIREVSRE